jgi:hypothetical protein
MSMEVSVGCGSASVAIVDANSVPIVEFNNIRVIGAASFCNPNRDTRLNPVFWGSPDKELN